MLYIAIGALGIFVVHLCDPAAIRKLPLVKPFTWAVGVGLIIYAIVMGCVSPDKIQLPAWTVWFGWILLTASLLLIVYSLFINLPFRKTYLAKGVGDKLVTSGLYALVRHPGLMWTILFVISLILVSSSRLVLLASPIFIALDIVVILLQDRFFFPQMFSDYKKYQRETPMLIPNRRSIRLFFDSLKRPKIEWAVRFDSDLREGGRNNADNS